MNKITPNNYFILWVTKPCKSPLANLLLLLLSSLFLFMSPIYLLGAPTGLYFSAPYSGEKVVGYEVTLPVTRIDKQLFKIPDGCQAVHDALSKGAEQWGNRVEHSIWRKVRQDCDYVSFIHSFPHPPLHDFVSNYDFMNAELQDIPIRMSCDDATDEGSDSHLCNKDFPKSMLDISLFFPWWREEENISLQEPPQTCRITNGIFRGQVIYDQTGIRCEQDPSAPGFRLIAVDYADVNGDDYLDAILRLVPLGRGLRRAPLILPLTRKKADGIFTIPKNLPRPVPTP